MTGDSKNYKFAFSAEAVDADKPLCENELHYKNGAPDPKIVSR